MNIKWLDINSLAFDTQNKEYVKITNGIKTGETFTPTEAIAVRFISLDNGRPVLAFTYRKVNPDYLAPANDGGHFDALFSTQNSKHYKFIGRV